MVFQRHWLHSYSCNPKSCNYCELTELYEYGRRRKEVAEGLVPWILEFDILLLTF